METGRYLEFDDQSVKSVGETQNIDKDIQSPLVTSTHAPVNTLTHPHSLHMCTHTPAPPPHQEKNTKGHNKTFEYSSMARIINKYVATEEKIFQITSEFLFKIKR